MKPTLAMLPVIFGMIGVGQWRSFTLEYLELRLDRARSTAVLAPPRWVTARR